MISLIETRLPTAADRPRLSRGKDLVTLVGGTWLIVGLFLDGWAHASQKPESFFSPWHAVLYAGFLATAGWICWLVSRSDAPGRRGRAAVPVGYGLGLAGVGIFAAGAVSDLVWHEIFGIEVDLEALLSPSHLLLFAGALLILSTPFRAAWSDTTGTAPRFGELLPALLSTTLVTALIAFFLMYLSPFTHAPSSSLPYRYLARVPDRDLAGWLTDLVGKDGIASVLLTTVIFMGPVLLLVRRWLLPPGALTLLFATVAVLLTGLEGFFLAWTAVAALLAGVVADVLVARLRPSPSSPRTYLVFAGAVPAVLWLTYFGVIQLRFGLGWSVELWAGTSAVSALAGAGLAVLTLPTPDRLPSSEAGCGAGSTT